MVTSSLMSTPTKATHRRLASLLPKGIPRYARCYRDDAYDWDKWTVIFTGRAAPTGGNGQARQWPCVGLSGHAFSDHQPADTKPRNGTGYVWPPAMGRKCYLGVRVAWSELPEHLRRVALEDYREIWRLPESGLAPAPRGKTPLGKRPESWHTGER